MQSFLPLMCASRFGVSIATMSYAGVLPVATSAWQMNAVEAGTVQASFNFCYAVSLLIASWLADHVGARRVFVWSLWSSAAAFVAFATLGRSYDSAVVLFGLVGLCQGGTYTPAIMLVAQVVEPRRRGAGIGALLSAASFGFIAAILLTMSLGTRYELSLYLAAIGPIAGAIAGTLALRGIAPIARENAHEQQQTFHGLFTRTPVLLTAAYTGHSWELLGMWAWTPAFLAAALSGRTAFDPLVMGIAIALAIHFSSVVANVYAGSASDRWGRRCTLIVFAAAGAVLSAVFGWCMNLPSAALLSITFAYGFVTIADSGVLSTAMAESVPPRRLGSMLAVRSILGYGAGGISPIVFGWILDAWPASRVGWGIAFMVLGIGGGVAALCSLLLPRKLGRAG